MDFVDNIFDRMNDGGGEAVLWPTVPSPLSVLKWKKKYNDNFFADNSNYICP